jgi:hypothetical protein
MNVDTKWGAGPLNATAVRNEVLMGLEIFREDIDAMLHTDVKIHRYYDILLQLDSAARHIELALRVPAEESSGLEAVGNDIAYQYAVIASSKRLLMNARTLLSHVHDLISKQMCLP